MLQLAQILAKKWRKGAFAFGGIGRIGLIRPIGHQLVDSEDAAVAYLAALAGGKYLYVPPAAVKIVSQRDTISEFQDRAVGFPNGNIHRVAAVKHSASGCNMNCFRHSVYRL